MGEDLAFGAKSSWIGRIAPILLLMMIMAAVVPGQALAWWNKAWAYRQQITIDTTRAGVPLQSALSNAPLVVRLHSGNTTFSEMRQDGADLRFIAEDDLTPLPFAIEHFDATNQIAIVRVLAPTLAPNRRAVIWMYYGSPKAAPASERKVVQDKYTVLAYDFEAMQGAPRDRTAYGDNAAQSTASPTPAGALGDGASFSGAGMIVTPASPSLQFTPDHGLTVTAWIKPDGPQTAVIFALGQSQGRSLFLTLEQGKLVARTSDDKGAGTAKVETEPLKLDGWRHVAVTLGADGLAVYVDGEKKASAPVQALPLAGPFSIGGWEKSGLGYTGLIDEVEISKVVRSDDWIRAQALGAGPEGRLVTVGAAEVKNYNPYLTVLKTIAVSVSLDGWVVIGIVLILGFVSGEAAVVKTLLLQRINRADTLFEAGRGAAVEGSPADPRVAADSSLYRIQNAAETTLADSRRRLAGRDAPAWSPALSDVIRAAIGRAIVGEAARLNKNMVLLSIAISGAPFLGLLGTVVGVMITFASIAAAGDVNVNTIAPGIAAAITATVSGLLVAIPVMFYYNILTARIREKMNDLEVFGEDVLSRIAFAASLGADHAA